MSKPFLEVQDFAGIAFVGMLVSLPFVLLGALPFRVLLVFIVVIVVGMMCHEG